MLIFGASNPLDHVVQHPLFDLNPNGGPFALPLISNHIIMQLVGAGLLVYFLPRFIARRAGTDVVGKFVPRGPATMIEAICVALRDQIFRPNLGKHTDTFAPFLWTVFFFIMTSNLLGMLPLADWFWFVPGHQIGGTSTGNIWVTGALAVMVLVMMVYNGLAYSGQTYVKHFFMGPFPINIFVAFLEVLGLGFKAMALAVRLFANMLGGHILLAVLMSFASLATATGVAITAMVVVASVLFYFLEIFVALLHAFIFTVLTAVFLGQSVNIHHDEHHDDAHGAHDGAHGHDGGGHGKVAHGH